MVTVAHPLAVDLDGLVPLLVQAIPGVQAVYLFGSAADGRSRPESDVDLAVLAELPVASEVIFAATGVCERMLRRDVDLVDLRSASLMLQAQIVGRGRRLASVGSYRVVAFFENLILAQYLSFVEERRPLVEEVVRRQRIHAA